MNCRALSWAPLMTITETNAFGASSSVSGISITGLSAFSSTMKERSTFSRSTVTSAVPSIGERTSTRAVSPGWWIFFSGTSLIRTLSS